MKYPLDNSWVQAGIGFALAVVIFGGIFGAVTCAQDPTEVPFSAVTTRAAQPEQTCFTWTPVECADAVGNAKPVCIYSFAAKASSICLGDECRNDFRKDAEYSKIQFAGPVITICGITVE